LDLYRDLTHPDFGGKGMVTTVTALSRVPEREEEPLVTSSEVLQTHVAIGREHDGLASEIADATIVVVGNPRLDQALAIEQVHDGRHRLEVGVGDRRRVEAGGLIQGEVEKSVRVVERRTQDLTTREILERRRDSTAHRHQPRVDRTADAQPRQRGAKRAQQEDRLYEIAPRLLDGQRGQAPVVDGALG